MKKIIIVGGGLAGLSLSVFLKGEFEIELIEASPKLGGRAYSFYDPVFDTEIDNGQHLLMGCYKNTLHYLSLINSNEEIEIRKKLDLLFIESKEKQFRLSSSFSLYPFDLLTSIFTFKLFTFIDRVKIVKLLTGLIWKSKNNSDKSVYEWLVEQKQSTDVINKFWSLLVKSMMNTSVRNASANLFIVTLKEVFLKGSSNSKFVVPKTGLSELFVKSAKGAIEQAGGKIALSERVTKINIENNKVVSVLTNKREVRDFDITVFCIPPYSIEKIENYELFISPSHLDFDYSPILSAHISLKNNNLKDKIYGFTDSKIDWIFNHCSYISVVMSAANDIINEDNEIIEQYLLEETGKKLDIVKDNVKSIKIIKEKRATPVFTEYSNHKRPDITTKVKNLYLCGDWVNTGLPATIESAILAAKKISDILKKSV